MNIKSVTAKKIFQTRELPLIVVVAGVIAALTFLSPYFFTSGNFEILARQTGLALLISVGMTFVILTAGIDLSVGSVVALSSVIVGEFIINFHWNPALSVFVSLIGALLVGYINGLFTTYLKLPAFVSTLGMLAIARGLALGVTGGSTIEGFSEGFLYWGQGKFLGLPVPACIALVVAVLSIFVLRKTVFGRQVFFIGSNESAALLSGIPVRKVKIATFMIASFLAGLSGVLETSRLGVSQPSAGNGYELVAIGACVIGGVSLFGGVGSVLGTILGTVLLLLIQDGLILLNISPYWQQVFSGAIIVISVSINLRTGKIKIKS